MNEENQFTIMWLRNFMLFFNIVFVIASTIGFVLVTNFANAISQEVEVAYIYNSFTITWIGGFVMLGLVDILIYYGWRIAKNPGVII